MTIEKIGFEELARRYCERQESTPEELRTNLQCLRVRFRPDAFVLFECQMFDSSRLGDLVIMGVGPNNTFKSVEALDGKPVSPRGLASDMSIAVAYCPAEEV